MGTIIDDAPCDRIINEIYVWVAIDPKTSLEGMVGMMVGDTPMQCVTSNRRTADMMKPSIALMTITGKRFKLLRFKNPEVVDKF